MIPGPRRLRAVPAAHLPAALQGLVKMLASPLLQPRRARLAWLLRTSPLLLRGPAENVPLPVMPELAKQESSEGLREFARYWYALLNYSFETGNVDSLKQVSGADCVLCKRAYEMLDIGYENEDWILGGKFVVHGTQSNYVLTSRSQYQVLAHVEQDAIEYRGPEAKVYETDEGLSADTVHMLEAAYVDNGWFVHNVVIIK